MNISAPTQAPLVLRAQTLLPQNFSPFGSVIGASDLPVTSINGGNAQRMDLLSDMQLTAAGGRPMLALFRAQARQFPLPITAMERHVLGSQSFVPLGTQRFVVVVARPGSAPQACELHAFVTNGRQGVVLSPGTWHHALLALDGGDFAVIERKGSTVDCELCTVAEAVELVL